jgi:hypothetical protein
MGTLAWIAAALVITTGMGGPPDDGTRNQYEKLRQATPADAASQIQLALWCEKNGIKQERARHLAKALLTDPENVLARSLMGQVKDGEEWKTPEDIAQDVAGDEARAEYRARRARVRNTVVDQAMLAQWCEKNGLVQEAQAHWRAVVRLDPRHDAAWKALGCKKVNGRWMTDAQVDAAKAEADAQKEADRAWGARLSRLLADLNGKNQARRDQAERILDDIDDPRAVPSICQVFFRGGSRDAHRGVQLLAQVDHPAASRALAAVALFQDAADVRAVAAGALRQRDPREYGFLVASQLVDLVRFEVRPVGGPGSPGVLFVEGKQFDTRRVYRAPLPDIRPGQDRIDYDANGMPFLTRYLGTTTARLNAAPSNGSDPARNLPTSAQGRATGERLGAVHGPNASRIMGQAFADFLAPNPLMGNPLADQRERWTYVLTQQNFASFSLAQMAQEADKQAMSAQARLEADVARLKFQNDQIARWNERAKAVLQGVIGEDLGPSRYPWLAWAIDVEGYYVPTPSESPRPVVSQFVDPTYTPQLDVVRNSTSTVTATATATASRSHSCFAAGTPVLARDGMTPIEKVRPGDLVLTCDTSSGALTFQPVLRAFHNPPNKTLRLALDGGETIVCTPIHRLWKAGTGWVMARELKPGDAIRAMDHIAQVRAVADGETQPVFNLEVASGQSFFVGDTKALVHDNSLITRVADPFDNTRLK